ncbi:MAG TPA: DEAD/DEAH box helicase, partial [Phycisphaerae bacterium]
MPFSSFGLHPDILRGVKDLAFTNPTPIQKEAIGPAVQGRDVLACAATGSGKTAAFLLPVLHRLLTHPAPAPSAGQRRTARALVLTPTRELAVQILDHLNSFATYTPISGAAIIGGMSMGQQAHAFRTGTEILIATPGRLLDHLRQAYARLDGVEVLVLDEADRMLDMGFLPDIRRILKVVPVKRQTLFFSATMPQEIRQLMTSILKDPVTIQMERQSTPAVGITQAIYPVPQHLKT